MLLTVLLGCFLLWLTLTSGAATVVTSPFFPFAIAVFSLLPLYPLYLLAKRWPRFALGIVMLVAGLLLSAVVAFVHYFLHLDGSWVQVMFNLSEILCVLSSLAFVWQAARRG